MNRTTFSLEIFGDHLPITDIYEHSTNSRQLNSLKAALARAINTELTERQKAMVIEFYFNGETVTSIAQRYNLSKSTVSRHLSRSRERLKKALKYGLFPLWEQDE